MGEGPDGRGQMGGGMLVLCPDPTQPTQGELAGWDSGHKLSDAAMCSMGAWE